MFDLRIGDKFVLEERPGNEVQQMVGELHEDSLKKSLKFSNSSRSSTTIPEKWGIFPST